MLLTRPNHHLFIIFFTFVSLNTQAQSKQNQSKTPIQIISQGPQSQQARIGDQVILKCKIENLAGEPQWCIDDFCLGLSRKNHQKQSSGEPQLTLKGRPRHKIIGDRSKGEYHLLIEPVQLQDNMFYYCMATAAVVDIKAVKSERVFLTVLTNPQSLNLPSPVSVSLNKPSSIQCIARQSRPPVKILMAVNGKLITDESKYSTYIIQKRINNGNPSYEYAVENQPIKIDSASNIRLEDMRNSFYDTITNLTVNDASMEMTGQSVECFVYSFMSVDNKPHIEPDLSLDKFKNNVMNTKSQILVNYAPEVNLEIISSNKVLKEEDVVNLVCNTKATPEIQSYKWYIGESFLPGVVGSTLNLKLRKEMHMKTITCEAANTVASVKASIQLNILYMPSFQRGSRSFMTIDKNACNQPLTLDCHVNANPGANITWYRRHLNQNLYKYVKQSERTNTVNYSKLKKLNINDYYYDELIGTGPTYTVASFNCADKLANIRNQTTETSQTNPSNSLATQHKNTSKRDTQIKPIDAISPSVYDESVYDEYMETDYEYENEGDNFHTQEDINVDFTRTETPLFKAEFDDFGIYMCEAKNIFPDESHYEERSARRFIKINPVGPPILRVLSAPSSSFNLDEIISSIMVPGSENDAKYVELPSSPGESISLTCLIEPLPDVQTIVWLKDNGKIIPNSKYTIHDSRRSGTFSVAANEPSEQLDKRREILKNNYRIKYENLTLIDSRLNSSDTTTQQQREALESLVESLNGVQTTRSDAGLMRSVLYIKNVREQDFGMYKCKSSNAYGSRVGLILVREKTLLDKMNLNSYSVFLSVVSGMIFVLAVLLVLFMCLVSKRVRAACCCFCFSSCADYTDRIAKEKELLSQNSNCEQHSDKTINEWLASSKLSNETGTSSLLLNNNGNNTSTNTAATLLLNGLDNSCINMNNSLTKKAKTSLRLMTHTPIQLRRDLIGNCSSLLNDEIDDDPSSSNEALEQTRRHNNINLSNLGLLNDPILDFNSSNNTFNKRDPTTGINKSSLQYSSSSQFNRFLVSSPFLSSSSQKDSSISDEASASEHKSDLLTSLGTSTTTKAMNLPPMLTIRSNNMPNGNFNATITAGHQRPQFNTFTLSRGTDSSVYENNTNNATNLIKNSSNSDLSRMLQDTTFRLSDLFNELSPHIEGNNKNVSTLPSNSNSRNVYQSTLPKSQINPISVFSSEQTGGGSRQNLLIQQNNLTPNQANFNKFPNPFMSSTLGTKSANPNSKFYSNLYRNPNLQANAEIYNFNQSNNSYLNGSDPIKQMSNNSSGGSTQQPGQFKFTNGSSSTNSPIAKIVTTSTENGSNKYQTVV